MSETIYYIGTSDVERRETLSSVDIEDRIKSGTVTAHTPMMSNKWDGWKRCEDVPEFKHLFKPTAQTEHEESINYWMAIACSFLGAIVTWAICRDLDWTICAACYCGLMGAGFSYARKKGDNGMILAVVIGGIGALLGALIFHYADIWDHACALGGSTIGAAIGTVIGATIGAPGDLEKKKVIGGAILGAVRTPYLFIKCMFTGKIKWWVIGFGSFLGMCSAYIRMDEVGGFYEVIGFFVYMIVSELLCFTLVIGICGGLAFMLFGMIYGALGKNINIDLK